MRNLDRDGFLLEQLFFTVNHCVDVGGGELESVAVRDGVSGAGFYAITAEDAARVVNIIDAGVTLSGGNSLGLRIFGGFNVNASSRAGRGAEETAYAFFQPVFVAMENVNASVAGLEVYGFFWIVLGDRFPQHIAECHAETLYQSEKCFASFLDHR
ncbi:MAG TPA: hypothetical protein VFE02_09555 [Candidatus Acidoferrales bacterium]|nr:hypothetical protein [Candidatus Acidoferrales bacterium]